MNEPTNSPATPTTMTRARLSGWWSTAPDKVAPLASAPARPRVSSEGMGMHAASATVSRKTAR